MAKELHRHIALMLEANMRLHALIAEEAWERFAEETGAYVCGMRELSAMELLALTDDIYASERELLNQLLNHDRTLRQAIQSRLTWLGDDISALQKSSVSAQAYRTI